LASYLQYLVDLWIRPQTALGALLHDPWRIGYGLLGHLALAAVYFAGISLALAWQVAPTPQFLVLRIPAERYYHYERFFILPVGLAGTILAAGTVRLAARGWAGQGQFEDLFALLGFSLIVVAVVMGIPDLVLAVLARAGIRAPLGWGAVGLHVWLGTLWYLALMVLAVKQVERLAWGPSIVLGLTGFVVNGAVQFIFVR
jgi:hypothetical protein